ncbi:MAG: multiheme c-type cytochrome, partial [Gemmataceae bacterium]
LKGTPIVARTDAHGFFRLPAAVLGRRVTAWNEGYFIGGSRSKPFALIHLTRLPTEDNAEYEWVDPAPNAAEIHNCANCHAEIYREWSHSGHSRSVNGRRFRNLYEGTDWHDKPDVGWGLLTQYPDGAGVCASCHAPAAREYDLRQVKGVAERGVHCDYCHKIESVADGTIGLTHGRFNLRLLRPSEGQLFFGALDDVDRGEDAYSPLYRDSRYCASCHDGIVFGVHVYSTFSEWQASPAARQGRQCQDCHMKPTGRMSNMAPGHGGIPRDPSTLANHRFFDGSQEAMLRRAVKSSVKFERRSDGVRARVHLWAEGVGHRLPTGFIDRHLVLIVEGRTEQGQTVLPRAGPKLPALAGKEWAGRPGRLYARVLRDSKGRSPAPFWLAAPDPPTDTRLVPGQIAESLFSFPTSLSRLRLRVLYRRFWPEVARGKHWPEDELLVSEQEFTLPAK